MSDGYFRKSKFVWDFKGDHKVEVTIAGFVSGTFGDSRIEGVGSVTYNVDGDTIVKDSSGGMTATALTSAEGLLYFRPSNASFGTVLVKYSDGTETSHQFQGSSSDTDPETQSLFGTAAPHLILAREYIAPADTPSHADYCDFCDLSRSSINLENFDETAAYKIVEDLFSKSAGTTGCKDTYDSGTPANGGCGCTSTSCEGTN